MVLDSYIFLIMSLGKKIYTNIFQYMIILVWCEETCAESWGEATAWPGQQGHWLLFHQKSYQVSLFSLADSLLDSRGQWEEKTAQNHIIAFYH